MKNGCLIRLLCLFGLVLSTVPASTGEVNLSIAASLKDACDELTDGFAGTHPGMKFLKNYGGSGALAKQIENGERIGTLSGTLLAPRRGRISNFLCDGVAGNVPRIHSHRRRFFSRRIGPALLNRHHG